MTSDKTFLLQVSSGRGPLECQLAAARVCREIIRQAGKEKLVAEMISQHPGNDRDTLASAVIAISGTGAMAFCKSWQGPIKWIAKSTYRPLHKRQNWFVAVTSIAQEEAKDSNINLQDIVFETFGGSGPGGQHVNKTDSAVRAKHLPSGHVIVVKSERSQHANKKLATTLLKHAVEQDNTRQANTSKKQQWALHEKLERGNPVRVFVGTAFKERQL